MALGLGRAAPAFVTSLVTRSHLPARSRTEVLVGKTVEEAHNGSGT